MATVQELVAVNTGWKLGTTDRFVVGTCSVDVSYPCEHMSFSRGFPLYSPGHRRCALYALILGLELVDGNEELLKEGRLIAISTKSKWVVQSLENSKRWRAAGKWPKDSGSYRNMLTRVADLVESLPPSCRLVLVEDGEESSEVKLDEFAAQEDEEKRIVMDDLKNYPDPQAELGRRIRERKMREILLQKALATGAKIVPNRKKK
jgi:hypothetical protein